MTKLLALGVVGAGVYAAVKAKRATAAKRQQDIGAFDYGDLDEPVVIAEEVIVVTEAGPYEIEMELVPGPDAQNQNQTQAGDTSTFDAPGRGAGPR